LTGHERSRHEDNRTAGLGRSHVPPASHDAIVLLDELRLTLEDLPEGALPPAAWRALGFLQAHTARLYVADEVAAA